MDDNPKSLDVQERYEYWREKLKNEEDYPVLADLEYAWKLLDSEYRFGPPLGDWSETKLRESFYSEKGPLVALMCCIEDGFYPPPEVLMALLDRWNGYLYGGGNIDLELALIGPPKKKTGNYAGRYVKWAQPIAWAGEISRMMEAGLGRMEAAEKLVTDWNLPIDPESVLRRARDTAFEKHRIKKERNK